MVIVANTGNIVPEEYDEVWIIMRSIRSVDASLKYALNAIQVDELSPSQQLFGWYRNEKEHFRWDEETFKNSYVPRFLHEMHSDSSKKVLNRLYSLSNARKICICCSCTTEKICHRSIIGGLLAGAGAVVLNEYGTDMQDKYGQYYHMWKDLSNPDMHPEDMKICTLGSLAGQCPHYMPGWGKCKQTKAQCSYQEKEEGIKRNVYVRQKRWYEELKEKRK